MNLPHSAPALRRMDRATYERELRLCIERYISGELSPEGERAVLRRSEALTALFAAAVGRDEAQRSCDRLLQEATERFLDETA